MDEIKLKPCPFCGGKAHLRKAGSLYFAMCKAAAGNCPVKPWVGRFGNRSEAITAWNWRAEHE